jgi:hypothetical protein
VNRVAGLSPPRRDSPVNVSLSLHDELSGETVWYRLRADLRVAQIFTNPLPADVQLAPHINFGVTRRSMVTSSRTADVMPAV